MSIQRQILVALQIAIDALGNYANLSMGALPDVNGISIAPSAGGTEETTLAHGGQYTMAFVLNAKHAVQMTAYDALSAIHEHLNKLSAYPSGAGWKVTSITTTGAPGYVDRDESQWLYGSGLMVTYIID